MTFALLLVRLDALLQQHRPAYYAQLQPPVPPAEVAAFEAEFQFTLPTELRTWLGWRNGQAASCFDSLVGYYSLPSLADMADTMRINCELLADGDFVANWWRPGWLPFATNGSGDHLCLDLEGTFTGHSGQIIEHWHDYEARSVLYPDFTAWLAATVHTYEQAYADGQRPTEEELADIEPEVPAGFPQEFTAG